MDEKKRVYAFGIADRDHDPGDSHLGSRALHQSGGDAQKIARRAKNVGYGDNAIGNRALSSR